MIRSFFLFGLAAYCLTAAELPIPIEEIERALDNELHAWYPRCIDTVYGGYLTHFDARWQPLARQNKMIVTQARCLWTACKAAMLFPQDGRYRSAAEAGLPFLREKMWDLVYGGFYQERSREGGPIFEGYTDEKRVYGNAFGLYAVTAYYELTHDPKALEFAKEIFNWIEKTAYDSTNGGYFDYIRRDGRVYGKGYGSSTGDSLLFGYKDQNATIHLLEAYSELYRQWPDPFLRERLLALHHLVRDVFTGSEGYMRLFFTSDWQPVSHRDSTEAFILRNYYYDHISFGHDIETAYLLLEASDALGLKQDEKTLTVAKKKIDFVLDYGWDVEKGGVYHAGYWFKGESLPRVIKREKDWWAQAEALNSLLMISLLYPNERRYRPALQKQWEYIKTYLIDWENGSWFSLGLDETPAAAGAPKAHAWKGPYHTGRALMNCLKMLHTGRLFDDHVSQ
ncbi:MAG: AGE family epimerase/isomerase [candidate division KSB1 bacterium]|nr:AGE family epimerase/isomerase [candidate division KSB1 bacterium]